MIYEHRYFPVWNAISVSEVLFQPKIIITFRKYEWNYIY